MALPLRTRWKWFVLVFGLLPALGMVCGLAPAPPEVCDGPGVCCLDSPRWLRKLDPCDLLRMYGCADVGRFPVGYMRGGLLVMTDFPCPRLSVALSGLAWKGKHVGCDGTFINQFTGVRAIGSQAFIGPSWYDGKPTIVMQYPPKTPLFGNIRDEFREISPGLYLGLIFERCPCPRHLGYMYLQIDPRYCPKPY
jgi:hypothetical protein